jgi:uracil-DNA glycosylase
MPSSEAKPVTNITIIGEAYGEAEDKAKRPFVGASGQELNRMLAEAGIDRSDCYLTNVFNLRPAGNKIEALTGPKASALPGFPALIKGKHVRKEFENELLRLGDEVLAADSNLVICLGNTPLWAMAGTTGISKLRGTTLVSSHTVSGYKLLPTYHPAAVLRQWELRPTTIVDLMKAKREALYPEIRRPKREIWIEPSLPDIERFFHEYLPGCRCLGVDIETSGNQITCIGFSPRTNVALVIPFTDSRRVGRNYWGSQDDELAVWKHVKRVLGVPSPPKVFQNGVYDIAFLWRSYKIKVRGAQHDTMLLHHSLHPEALKGLGYLGSVYTDEGSWKHMRKTSTIKRDE